MSEKVKYPDLLRALKHIQYNERSFIKGILQIFDVTEIKDITKAHINRLSVDDLDRIRVLIREHTPRDYDIDWVMIYDEDIKALLSLMIKEWLSIKRAAGVFLKREKEIKKLQKKVKVTQKEIMKRIKVMVMAIQGKETVKTKKGTYTRTKRQKWTEEEIKELRNYIEKDIKPKRATEIYYSKFGFKRTISSIKTKYYRIKKTL